MAKRVAREGPQSADRSLIQFGVTATSLSTVVQTLIRWGAAVWIAYYAHLVLLSFAGLDTKADVVVNFLGRVSFNSFVSWCFGGAGVAYGLAQKRLKEKHTERMANRIASLEQSIDPQRTSSGLTPKGRTNPKDKS